MSQKTICSIPRAWSLADYRTHACSDGSHRHFSHSQIEKLEKDGLVIWLQYRDKTKSSSGVCYVIEHVAEVEKIFTDDSFGAGSPINAGLSFRVGAYHASQIVGKQPWAQVMLAEINGSHLASENVE